MLNCLIDQVIFTNLLKLYKICVLSNGHWYLSLVFVYVHYSFQSAIWCIPLLMPSLSVFSSCLIWWPSFPLQMWCHIIRLLLQRGAATSSESGIPRFVSKLTKMQERKKIHVCAKTFESLHEMLAFEGLGAQKLFCSSNTSGVHT